MRISVISAFAVSSALLAACGTMGPTASKDSEAGCRALAGTVIPPSAIGIPSGAARIASAEFIKAAPLSVAERGPTPASLITPATPDYCKVLGSIAPLDPKAPDINFQINLPANWNGRSVQYGGGGFNGVLINALSLVPGAPYDRPAPLAQGFVTYGTDSGHQNKPNEPPQTFALNDEALLNFSHASYKKVRDTAVAVMRQAYGRSPSKLYFVGSSEGGREGLTMAQRYPTDFNGIFSRVPVIHWTGLQHAGLRDGLALMNSGWLGPQHVALVHDAVIAACDAADGATDGIISNPVGCRERFKPRSLLCSGAPSDKCLSEAQVKAVEALNSPLTLPMTLANGLTTYPGRGPSGENLTAFGPTGGWKAWWTGSTAPTIPPQPSNGIAWFYGAGAIQYFYAKNPTLDLRQYKAEEHAARIAEVSALMDSTNPDLSAFRASGGRLIMLEHMADYAQSPYAGIEYFESVQKRMGADKVAGFMRLYTAPGVDHVGAGAPANVDMLAALVDWVEYSKPPRGLTISEQPTKAPFTATRSRPLCEWPAWPRYRSGDVNSAASFECAR